MQAGHGAANARAEGETETAAVAGLPGDLSEATFTALERRTAQLAELKVHPLLWGQHVRCAGSVPTGWLANDLEGTTAQDCASDQA